MFSKTVAMLLIAILVCQKALLVPETVAEPTQAAMLEHIRQNVSEKMKFFHKGLF